MKQTDFITPIDVFDTEELEGRFEMTPWIGGGDCPPSEPEPEILDQAA
jgi:hypothetical protein